MFLTFFDNFSLIFHNTIFKSIITNYFFFSFFKRKANCFENTTLFFKTHKQFIFFYNLKNFAPRTIIITTLLYKIVFEFSGSMYIISTNHVDSERDSFLQGSNPEPKKIIPLLINKFWKIYSIVIFLILKLIFSYDDTKSEGSFFTEEQKRTIICYNISSLSV